MLSLNTSAWRMLDMRQADDRRQAEARLWSAARARGARRRAVICGHARALRAMGARHGRERLEVESRLWRAVLLALGQDLLPRGGSSKEGHHDVG